MNEQAPTHRPVRIKPDEIPAPIPGRSRIVEPNGVPLHHFGAGPEDGGLVFPLHGLSDVPYGWRDVVRPLRNAYSIG